MAHDFVMVEDDVSTHRYDTDGEEMPESGVVTIAPQFDPLRDETVTDEEMHAYLRKVLGDYLTIYMPVYDRYMYVPQSRHAVLNPKAAWTAFRGGVRTPQEMSHVRGTVVVGNWTPQLEKSRKTTFRYWLAAVSLSALVAYFVA